MIIFFGRGGGVGWEAFSVSWSVFPPKVMVSSEAPLGCRGCFGGIMAARDCPVLFLKKEEKRIKQSFQLHFIIKTSKNE
jgi:hypothetical protein